MGLAVNTFHQIGMAYNGIFVVALRYVIEIVLVIFVIGFVTQKEDFESLIAFFFKPALFIFTVTSVFQILTNSFEDVQGVNRILGPFGSPTTLASFLHLFIAITFFYYEGRHNSFFWMLIIAQYI